MKYIKKNKKYQLIDSKTSISNPHIIAEYDTLAVVFDVETGALLKHGEEKRVNEWYSSATTKYKENGLDDIADDMIILSGQIDQNKLNKCIDCSGTSHRVFAKEIQELKGNNNGSTTKVVSNQEDTQNDDQTN